MIQTIKDLVSAKADTTVALAREIWGYAELPYEETKSAAALISALKQEGFTIEEGIAGIPTAFTATFTAGSGKPVVGFLAEYDALSGLSQKAGCPVQELFTRVVDVAKGAALMTGTKMKYEITMAFSDYVPNRTLGAVVDQCMRELGAPEWTEADYRLAAEFLRTYPRTTMVGIREKLGYYFEPEELDAALEKPLDRVIHPFNPKETAYSSGSTDVGDVGYATPTVMFHVATACLGNVGHSWQNTAFACSGIGMKGMLRAAEIMTLAAIRTMDQPAVIAKAREELKQKNGGSYHCPLPDYVTPPIGRY